MSDQSGTYSCEVMGTVRGNLVEFAFEAGQGELIVVASRSGPSGGYAEEGGKLEADSLAPAERTPRALGCGRPQA